MPDLSKKLLTYSGSGPKIRYKDLGDDYYAEVVAIDGGTSGGGSTGPTEVFGSNTRIVRVNPPVSASPNYSINDVLGNKMVLSGIARVSGAGGIINSIVMTSKVDIPVGVTVDILLFNSDPTNSTFTDNAALAVNVNDLPSLLPGIATLSTKVSLGATSAMLVAQNLGIPIDTLTTDTIWAVAVVRGAGTLDLASTSDIQFVFGFLPD